jgi:choline dehydrogenase-like flavoprotein
LNATVTTIDVSRRGVVRVEAASLARDVLCVTAKRVIIAAGAIETTRLALLLDRRNSGVITSVSPKLGSFFADHLSVPVAEILVKNRKRLNTVVGYRFGKGGSMRNLRFELSNETPLRHVLPPSFCHISFETTSEGGFDALKAMYRSLQMKRIPSFSVLTSLLKSTPWLAQAAWWRFVHHRLLYPSDARIRAHMVIEQSAREENKITLSATKVDELGVPLIEIDWSVNKQDVQHLTKSTDAFEATWRNTNLSQLGDWVRRPEGEAEQDLLMGGGIYHPTGSTRMARSASEGVVDKDLRLFNVPEIQLLATSVLPNGGGANPTMMLMLLALRCVQQHRKNGRET